MYRLSAAVLLLLCAGMIQAQEDQSDLPPLLGPHPIPRLLFPANCAILSESEFEIIALAPDSETEISLKIDKEKKAWEAWTKPVHSSLVALAPGKHSLMLNNVLVDFFIRGEGQTPPEDWVEFKRHPGTGKGPQNCSLCHEIKEEAGLKKMVELKGSKACFECHNPNEFVSRHAHVLEPLEDCHLCHAIHGSQRKNLLKAPARELCAACHD